MIKGIIIFVCWTAVGVGAFMLIGYFAAWLASMTPWWGSMIRFITAAFVGAMVMLLWLGNSGKLSEHWRLG